MIRVIVGTNTSRETVIVDEATATPKSVLVDQSVDFTRATISLDGASLPVQQMNQTFADLNIPADSQVYLIATVKIDTAS